MKKEDVPTGKKETLKRSHKDILGMEVPQNYFASSRASIMKKVSDSTDRSVPVFYMKPVFRYAIAALVVLLIGLGISLSFLTDNSTDVTLPDTANYKLVQMADEDIILTALLVSDEHFEDFMDQYLFDGVLMKAELDEQEFDNIFMNSLLVNDSLIDTYIDDRFIDDIIL